jgi:class 3 adenylate cyclase/DNA-binding XRE family transcriptional regulator
MTVGESPQPFALLVREHRLQAGLTQEELAERAGISARSVSDLERGLYQAPHRDTVARLALALSLSPEAAAQLEAAVVRQRGPTAPPSPQRGRDDSLTTTRQLPTGIVTFLATLIDESDRLGEQYPRQMAESVSRLVALTERCVQPHAGVLVRSGSAAGDQLAVFATASEAVAAAVNIQQLVRLEPWPIEAQLKLLVALHTGEAELRSGDYYGSAVIRCARMSSFAAAGQILLSQTTGDLARASLPAGAALRDLGEFQLTDVGRPERIYELSPPGVPSHFPPPRAASSIDAQYDAVLRGLLAGRVVLFVGDAIDTNGRRTGATWQRGQPDQLPTTNDVAASLATRFDYPPDAPQELSRVAQYVSTMAGIGPLFEELHEIFAADYMPTPLHQLLARLPPMLDRNRGAANYPLIVSSSYDHALELAFVQADQPFDLVSYVAEGELRGKFVHQPPDGKQRVIDKPNKYPGLSFDQRAVILKVHGSADRTNAELDSFVITEDHFLDYLTGGDISNLVPVTIAARLRRSHFLFLGYSVRNWNLRIILRRLWGEQRLSYKSWAVQSTLPDSMERGLWRDQGVDVLDVRLDHYLDGLGKRCEAEMRTLL